MRAMNPRSAEYIEAASHLPAEAILLYGGVTWEEYEAVLQDLESRPGLRVSYDEGRLEIVSPSDRHEYLKEVITLLARAFAEAAEIPLEDYGSTTWKRQKIRKGAEPDACFYVANADRVIGKPKIDLERDPAPDVVVEVEITRGALNKFSIYAALGVPEIWRYDGKSLHIYELASDGRYTPAASSCSLPGLMNSILTEFIEFGKSHGQTEMLKAFRRVLQARKP